MKIVKMMCVRQAMSVLIQDLQVGFAGAWLETKEQCKDTLLCGVVVGDGGQLPTADCVPLV